MSDSRERDERTALIISNLVKLYVAVELSGDYCPVCRKAPAHDGECPVALAWSFLSAESQDEARRSLRALALTLAIAGEGNGLEH